jgi:ribosome-binding ATPase YchF (GTP1/OBG family)
MLKGKRDIGNKAKKITKYLQLRKDLGQISEDRRKELNLIEQITYCAKQIYAWTVYDRNTEAYREN